MIEKCSGEIPVSVSTSFREDAEFVAQNHVLTRLQGSIYDESKPIKLEETNPLLLKNNNQKYFE